MEIPSCRMAFLQFLLLLHTSHAFTESKKERFQNEVPIYGTKTAYGWLPDKNDFFSNPPKLHSQVLYKNHNCSAMHVYTILRHGARNPGLGDTMHIKHLQKMLSKIKSFSLTTEHLKGWKSPFSESDESQLIALGRTEHMQIAHRFMDALDNVFIKNHRLQPMRFVSSYKQRSVDSMKAFGDGVKDYLRKQGLDVNDFEKQVTQSINNTLLRFYDNCTFYQNHVKQNKKKSMPDFFKFLKGDKIHGVVKKINKLFEVDKNFFNHDDGRVMNTLCAFEQCLLNSSDWCRLFDHEDHKLFEYLSDIKQYWVNSYGHKVNYLQSCPIMKDLLNSILNAVKAHRKGENYTKGNFMFGHGETLAPVYSDLGLFKDNMPLKADNFEQQDNRKFRSSYILPFAANIAIITYHCEIQEGICIQRNNNDLLMDQATDHVVQMYLNERLIEIPDCGTTCSFSQFINKYKNILSCDYNRICHLKEP